MKLYHVAMRVLALIAFVAVQLSVFTCGFDIHVHAMGADNSHVAEHLHDGNSQHDKDSVDHGCHVHASHTYAPINVEHIGHIPPFSTVQYHILAESNPQKIPFLIEHPPKLIRS